MTGGPHSSTREVGGPARQRRARAGRSRWAAGEEREGGRSGPSRPKKGKGGERRLLLGFSFYKTFLTLFISFQLLFVL